MTTKTKPVAKKKGKKKPYNATLHMLGKKFTGKGASPAEALEAIVPGNAKGKGILQMEKDGQIVERILTPALTFRVFSAAGMTKQVALKQVSLLFRGM